MGEAPGLDQASREEVLAIITGQREEIAAFQQ
jgi:hypothetical protein